MDKVGILTLYDPINYGACLQTYALRAFLECSGFDAEVIDYRPSTSGVDKRTTFQKVRSCIWKNTLYKLLNDKSRFEKTNQFKKENIKYSSGTFYNFEELNCGCSYDSLIVGSDQVWNPQIIGSDKAWFLGFSDASLRIAYAASFGVSQLDECFWKTYAESLKKLNAISVREETGAEIVWKLVQRRASVVVDPVFLISKKQWEKLSVQPSEKKKYILSYYMQGDSKVESTIDETSKKYAIEHNCKIINIGKRDITKLKVWEPNAFGIGPGEFLGLIQKAEAVVTNSFHGTAFSLIFEKPFVSVANTDKNSLASRIVDLLVRLNMQQWIQDVRSENEVGVKPVPERSKVLLQKEIEKGKAYVLNALEGKEKNETM